MRSRSSTISNRLVWSSLAVKSYRMQLAPSVMIYQPPLVIDLLVKNPEHILDFTFFIASPNSLWKTQDPRSAAFLGAPVPRAETELSEWHQGPQVSFQGQAKARGKIADEALHLPGPTCLHQSPQNQQYRRGSESPSALRDCRRKSCSFGRLGTKLCTQLYSLHYSGNYSSKLFATPRDLELDRWISTNESEGSDSLGKWWEG